MAVKKLNPAEEVKPQSGGSYIRDPETGELTQMEGPDMVPAASAPASPADNSAVANQE
jgi:hypothetical protein